MISAVGLFVLVAAVIAFAVRRRRPARRGGHTAAPFIGAGGAHHSTYGHSVHGGGFDGGNVSGGFDGGGSGGGGDGGGGGGGGA
ncbi:hypothetical protein [Saccharopolyspora gloriosae]|uniref:hypothetical protein n=1 Tax=Saccharopolyspora gloriosae TaxID=455344 RepID=UPI001FB68951|nr:hypothetical protein [Saccharopolyspora gloriosae]